MNVQLRICCQHQLLVSSICTQITVITYIAHACHGAVLQVAYAVSLVPYLFRYGGETVLYCRTRYWKYEYILWDQFASSVTILYFLKARQSFLAHRIILYQQAMRGKKKIRKMLLLEQHIRPALLPLNWCSMQPSANLLGSENSVFPGSFLYVLSVRCDFLAIRIQQ